MSEPWLTKREIAVELKVSIRTVERLHLPAMRVGGQNRYRRSEAEAFLRGRRSPNGPGGAEVIQLRPEVSA